jgi:V/A-type H+-transporting ATPase subunit E
MGYEALFAELRRLGEERRQALWREAEEVAARERQQAAVDLEQERRQAEQRCAAVCAQRRREIGLAAAQESRRLKGLAEAALAERLLRIARRVMPVLQDENRALVFSRLAAELPPREWEKVHVNPADVVRGRDFFPQAEVVADGGIAGGLEALAASGRVRVINTMEKRLERAWPMILPAIFQDLRVIADDRSAP